MRRGRKQRLSRFGAGLLALVVVVVASTVGWFRINPFEESHAVRAEFAQVSNLAVRSPVRIAQPSMLAWTEPNRMSAPVAVVSFR